MKQFEHLLSLKDIRFFLTLDIERNVASGNVPGRIFCRHDLDFVGVRNRVLQRFQIGLFEFIAVFQRAYDVLFEQNFVDIAVDICKKATLVAYIEAATLEVVAV